MPFKYIMNKSGPKTDYCGTPVQSIAFVNIKIQFVNPFRKV